MTDASRPFSRPVAVPSGRIARLSRLGGLATGVAGSMAWQGARVLATGQRPDPRALFLTPGNIARITDQLAAMRGAAMKVGQMMSMETGDLIPKDLAEILARLRAEAHVMPPRQLKRTLAAAWGADFLTRFDRFDVQPIAAASIGQVHRARTRQGEDLAIKVQYPGVRASIDADVDNVAALIRLSGLAPKGLDLGPLLADAKRQLHEEADYAREGAYLTRFGALLAGDAGVKVPVLHEGLTRPEVLAMSFQPGQPVEALATAAQAVRDRVATRLIGLLLRELFAFRLMQSDPNFANYRYDPETGRVVLLDFGATREIAPDLSARFAEMLRAAVSGAPERIAAAAEALGFVSADMPPRHRELILAMIEVASGPLRQTAPFDFGASDVAVRLREMGEALGMERDLAQIPPVETLLVMRKVAGMFLLATRLGARVDLRALLAPWLAGAGAGAGAAA